MEGGTILHYCLFQGLGLGLEPNNSYLPGRGDTMIKKVVHPGRGSSIALKGCADPCEFPKCGNLNCIISGSGGLRSRSPLIIWVRTLLFLFHFLHVTCAPTSAPVRESISRILPAYAGFQGLPLCLGSPSDAAPCAGCMQALL